MYCDVVKVCAVYENMYMDIKKDPEPLPGSAILFILRSRCSYIPQGLE